MFAPWTLKNTNFYKNLSLGDSAVMGRDSIEKFSNALEALLDKAQIAIFGPDKTEFTVADKSKLDGHPHFVIANNVLAEVKEHSGEYLTRADVEKYILNTINSGEKKYKSNGSIFQGMAKPMLDLFDATLLSSQESAIYPMYNGRLEDAKNDILHKMKNTAPLKLKTELLQEHNALVKETEVLHGDELAQLAKNLDQELLTMKIKAGGQNYGADKDVEILKNTKLDNLYRTPEYRLRSTALEIVNNAIEKEKEYKIVQYKAGGSAKVHNSVEIKSEEIVKASDSTPYLTRGSINTELHKICNEKGDKYVNSLDFKVHFAHPGGNKRNQPELSNIHKSIAATVASINTQFSKCHPEYERSHVLD